MKRFDLWKLSLLNVFSSPVRSMLTVLGFAIGVAAVLAVLTLGEAGKEQVQSEMGRLGIDRVWLSASGDKQLSRGTGEWLENAINVSADELIDLPAPISAENGKTVQAYVVGCDADYLAQTDVKEGRMLWPLEWSRPTQTALIGERLAEELDVHTGGFVTVAHYVYEICGILGTSEGVSSIPLEDSLILPAETLAGMTGGIVQEVQLQVQGDLSIQNAQRKALDLLEKQGNTVHAASLEVQMEAATSVIDTFVNVLKWVAMVCILVGGVGVMNILLVSVRERKREIGVMKSMGTTPVQICILFLLEALIYAVIGGILGILLGMGLIDAAGRSIQLIAKVSLNDCTAVFAGAMAVGVFFGVAPAFRASRLTCVDALRQE